MALIKFFVPQMTAVLIQGWCLLNFMSQMWCLFEGSTYSGGALTQVNTVLVLIYAVTLEMNPQSKMFYYQDSTQGHLKW